MKSKIILLSLVFGIASICAFSKEKVDSILKYNQALAQFLSSQIADKLRYKREEFERNCRHVGPVSQFHSVAP